MRHGAETGSSDTSGDAIRLARWLASAQLDVLHRDRMEHLRLKFPVFLRLLPVRLLQHNCNAFFFC
jgi:hypothetical protein